MFGFSLVSLYSYYLRRIFRSSGLYPQTIQIDPQTTIHCWLPTKSGFPSKPPLVLIHGFGPSAIWQWRSQVQSLSRHFSLYVPDLVFFGGSSTSSPERSEVFQAASVAKMLEKLGVEQFSVVGTSYGGFVAYNLGRICGEKVEKVVIASSGVSRRRRDNVELLEKAGAEKISDLMLPSTAKDLRTLLRLSVNRRLHIPDCLLNDVIHEVLIIWGEFDQIFPLEKAFELRKYMGEKVRMEVINKASHVPQIENPKRFNEIVKSFLLAFPNSST
ncbi:uncharacterized protein LOC131227315 isoform X3 [Magnolia sinica]|uniref:uncharacterized protein LOC131227315 isoform X3 n=1 Tax=Magnolia sinica TaxID=86752 RepID=UPI0026591189|nr:uncharacterized protein LOC131227315 isoform X3 [Magnolia sinica]